MNCKRYFSTSCVVAICLLVSLAGCQRLRLRPFCIKHFGRAESVAKPDVRKFSSFTSPRFSQLPPRRVLLVPAGLQSGNYDAPLRLADALAAEIRKSGVFEIVQPPNIQSQATVDSILNGRFDEREVTELAKAYHCDAVLFARVNQFQGYWPLQASVTAAIVDANESIVVLAVDGNWDIADPEIRQAYECFVDQRVNDVPYSSREIYLQSPKNLFEFIANQVTAVMREGIGR